MWCDNSYLGGRVLIMVGSRGTLVVLFQWRVRYVPIHASSLSSWNSPHEYHTYHEYKYLNTGKHQHPKSSNAKKRIWSHWQHHGTSAPQPDKASPRFDIRFPPRPSRNSMWICDIWANIMQICKCAKNREASLTSIETANTIPFLSCGEAIYIPISFGDIGVETSSVSPFLLLMQAPYPPISIMTTGMKTTQHVL